MGRSFQKRCFAARPPGPGGFREEGGTGVHTGPQAPARMREQPALPRQVWAEGRGPVRRADGRR